jgi:RNA polymerase sigma-70 factor (ECF subfamily)
MAVYYACHTGEDPDDLLQEAWIGLLEALPRIDLSIGSPEQHLIRRAKWHMLDAIKHARVRRCSSLDAIDPEESSQSCPENAVARVCVSEFARSLNGTQRAIVDCLLDGLTWREAGQVLGCSSANVAYHVRRIRQLYAEWNEGRIRREKDITKLSPGV